MRLPGVVTVAYISGDKSSGWSVSLKFSSLSWDLVVLPNLQLRLPSKDV